MTPIWKLTPPSPLARRIARETGLPLLAAEVLLKRGIRDGVSAQDFLKPRLSGILDPFLLPDMDRAVATLVGALEGGDAITVYGDYDADGLTATALLLNFFSLLEIPADYYIPNRLTEGHGLHRQAIQKIARERSGLLITVDCGTGSQEPLDLARTQGLMVIVTDHHQVPESFRPNCPFVNPHRRGSHFPFKNLAGVGIAFYVLVALRSALRERNWFKNGDEPDLRQFLDLVALGTVADMVPLVGQNRILVRSGIDRMKTSCWPGLRALQEVTQVPSSSTSCRDLAFKFAPRLNATGRLGEADAGIEILTTKEDPTARRLARRLHRMNLQRQSIEQAILEEIEKDRLPDVNLDRRRALVFSGKGWHRGVLGIVASRLMAKYHRPVLLLDIQNGMATGSGRSIEGFDLYGALSRVGHLLDHYGGHKRAAGLTLVASDIPALAEHVEGLARESLKEEDLIPRLDLDAVASLQDLTLDLLKRLEVLAPFGAGNPEPLFCSQGLEVMNARILGDNHLKLKIRQGETLHTAIGFGMGERRPRPGSLINAAYSPEINPWQGRDRIQLRIYDLEEITSPSRLITE